MRKAVQACEVLLHRLWGGGAGAAARQAGGEAAGGGAGTQHRRTAETPALGLRLRSQGRLRPACPACPPTHLHRSREADAEVPRCVCLPLQLHRPAGLELNSLTQ